MAKDKKITQPSVDEQRVYNDIVGNKKSQVMVRGKMWKVGWKHHVSLRKITDILLEDKGSEGKIVCKCAAALRLDNWWKIPLFYWLLWRYYYYIKCYTEEDLIGYIEECKKKVPVENYFGCIMLLTAMKDTMMMMTREEVNRIQAEQITERLGALAKNAPS